jgi:hypothetical protein
MQSLEELRDEVIELNAAVKAEKEEDEDKESKHKAALKAMKDEHKDAMKDEDEKHKAEIEHKDDEHKTKYESLKATLKAAMDEEEDEKKKEGMKAALKAMEDEHKKEANDKTRTIEQKEGKYGKEEDEEKKALKAEVTYLTAAVNKPKLDYLKQVYTAANTPDSELTNYIDEWSAMSSKQLDAAITQTSRLSGHMKSFEASTEQKSPFGFSTADVPGSHSTYNAGKGLDKIDKMNDKDLFSSPGVQ